MGTLTAIATLSMVTMLVVLLADIVAAVLRRRLRPQHALDLALCVLIELTPATWSLWLPRLAQGEDRTSRLLYVLLSGCLGLVVAGSLCFVLFLALTWGYAARASRKQAKAPARADYIVVLGARVTHGRPGRALVSRLESAAKQWRRTSGRGCLVLSGGVTAGEELSEAEVMASWMLRAGVPPEALLLECDSLNTRENLEFSREAILEDLARSQRTRETRREGQPFSCLIVTSDFHTLRTSIIARSVGLEARVVPAPTARPVYPMVREFYADAIAFPWPLPLGFVLGMVGAML